MSYDLLIGVVNYPDGGPIKLSITDNLAVDGVQKAVQRFLMALLTTRGSRIDAPDYGTTLLQQLRLGSIDESVLESYVTQAISETIEWLSNNLDLVSMGDDDVIQSVDLLSVTFTRATLTLEISLQINMRSGENRVWVTPINLNPSN
jgi:hypothetical protein